MIQIAKRFCGPPTSGNGGYVAGLLAAHVGGEPEAAGVRLNAPPPLETPLEVTQEEGGVFLKDGENVVAQARPVELELDLPDPVDFAEASEVARAFRGFEEHVFPRCFVCGPERSEQDGLRIFPGESNRAGQFAAPWIPDPTLEASGSARVADEFLWAALDCPGAFSFPQPEGRVVLLGEMQASGFAPVEIGEGCVVMSWEIEHSGRKHATGSAIYGADGRCRGMARGVWFEVDPESVPAS